jgi:hypothetical protein
MKKAIPESMFAERDRVPDMPEDAQRHLGLYDSRNPHIT